MDSKDRPAENIFTIMDEVIHHLNKTKKMFIVMIISIILVVPGTFIATSALLGGGPFWGGQQHNMDFSDGFAFGIARAIVIVFVVAWIVVGVRQWLVLTKWTQRYQIYKELQKRIDEKLDYESSDEKEQ